MTYILNDVILNLIHYDVDGDYLYYYSSFTTRDVRNHISFFYFRIKKRLLIISSLSFNRAGLSPIEKYGGNKHFLHTFSSNVVVAYFHITSPYTFEKFLIPIVRTLTDSNRQPSN